VLVSIKKKYIMAFFLQHSISNFIEIKCAVREREGERERDKKR